MTNTRFMVNGLYVRATSHIMVIGRVKGMPLGTYMLKQHTTKLMRDREAEACYPLETINELFAHVIDLDKTQVSIVNGVSVKWLEATLELAKAYNTKMVSFRADYDTFYVIINGIEIPYRIINTSNIEIGSITIDSFEIMVQELKREKAGTMMLTTTTEGHLKISIGNDLGMSIIAKTY